MLVPLAALNLIIMFLPVSFCFPSSQTRNLLCIRKTQCLVTARRLSTRHKVTNNNNNDFRALERANGHPLDKHITFDEKEHKYSVNGVPMAWSVTELLQRYFNKFDAPAVARTMMSGANWPRPEYCHPCGTPFTEEEVIAKWGQIGEKAKSAGVDMHLKIEKSLNGVKVYKQSPEMKYFQEFFAEHIEKAGITPFRTEWRVASPDLSLAGSVDFVGLDRNKSAVIIDWKRSKNLSGSGFSGFKNAKMPVEHMPDCDFSKYLLQLNLYRYILEKHYNMHVSKMLLVSLHPSLAQPFVWNVPFLTKEIQNIVEHLRENP